MEEKIYNLIENEDGSLTLDIPEGVRDMSGIGYGAFLIK